MTLFGVPVWAAAIAALIGVLSASRLTRLVVNDHWPPIEWLRDKWDARSEKLKGWWLLLHCPWCFSPWMTLLVGGWAVLSHLHWTWWAFNGWMACSYVAGWIVFHDEDGEREE